MFGVNIRCPGPLIYGHQRSSKDFLGTRSFQTRYRYLIAQTNWIFAIHTTFRSQRHFYEAASLELTIVNILLTFQVRSVLRKLRE
jgi:hypothetical protein